MKDRRKTTAHRPGRHGKGGAFVSLKTPIKNLSEKIQNMAEEGKKQLTLRIPAEVHKKMRILAAMGEKTMTEYFISIVEQEYKKHARGPGPVQLKLPV